MYDLNGPIKLLFTLAVTGILSIVTIGIYVIYKLIVWLFWFERW